MSSSSLSRRSVVFVVALAAIVACKPKPDPKPDPKRDGGSVARDGAAPSGSSDPAPAAIVSTLAAAAPRLRTAVAQAHGLTVADRTAMITAAVALDTALELATLWHERTSGAAVAPMQAALSRLTDDLDRLLGDHNTAAIRTHAADVYKDARALALTFSANRSSADGLLPAVTDASCQATSAKTGADLGALATTELVLGATRVGYPWVALSPNEIASRASVVKLVRPAWVRVPGPGSAEAVSDAHAAIGRRFGGDAAHTASAIAAFDAIHHAGFEATAAMLLAGTTSPGPQIAAELEDKIGSQITALTAAPTGAPSELVQVGALLDGLRTGARARAVALAANKPPGVVRDVPATWSAADKALATTKRELLACMLSAAPASTREASLVSLLMVAAYGVPGSTCTAGHDDCEPGTTCAGGTCKPACGCTVPDDVCADDKCAIAEHSCQLDTDCATGLKCNSGTCAEKCGAAFCARTQTCGATTCVDRGACATCNVGQFCQGENPTVCKTGPAQRTCVSDADCVPPEGVPSQAEPRCIAVAGDAGDPIKMCIGIGWACSKADDCGQGSECDRTIGQCVDRETYACNTTNACRAVEACVIGNAGAPPRCDPAKPVANQPCSRTDQNGHVVQGECTKGRWQTDGHGALACVLNGPSAEACDGLDNDCDGTVDDHVASAACPAGNATGACKSGHSTCVGGATQCLAGAPSAEVCDSVDNDCNGVVDDIPPSACAAAAVGDCANGRQTCRNGQLACDAAPASGEVCDHRDNDCNGAIDDLQSSHEAPVNDGFWAGNGIFGLSENHLVGPSDCGGTRASANATKIDGGASGCSVVDWADVVCQNPKQKIGNSTPEDACRIFTQQGGVPGPGNSRDCRFIFHIGTVGADGITCQLGHVVTVPDHCP